MSSKRPKGLGRGLEALLGSSTEEAASTAGALAMLPLAALQAGRYQPRTRMDQASLNELAESVKSQGLLQPILVRRLAREPDGAERYEIVAGERRFRAAAIAGLTEVPVLVREVPDEAAAVMALIENIQREDLNVLEEAQGVQRLLDEFRMTHDQAAIAIGRSRSATSNILRLLNLAKPVQAMLMAGDLDMGHARALLPVDAATQIQLAHHVVAKGLSVRQAEQLATRAASLVNSDSSLAAGQKSRQRNRDVARLEEDLSDALAAKVVIKLAAKDRGQIRIDFASLDALDGLISKLLPT